MTSPALSSVNDVTFAENTVNVTPQILDSTVTFTDPDDDFDGGALTVSGLLAEDVVSIASGLVISLSGGVVWYDADGAGAGAAVAIGTVAGGAGSTFTVTFNASATAAAIDLLIESLTYANSSHTPTASRTLILNVVDAAGQDLGFSGTATFSDQSGASNPWNGMTAGSRSAPALADLDNDGDLDVVVGHSTGALRYYENTGTATSPTYVEQTGAANPLDGVDVGVNSSPTFGDLDGDGDKDLVIGRQDGTFAYFRNTGSASAPVFAEQTGASNPLNGADIGIYSSPFLVDLDGDGDLDMVSGKESGGFAYFRNTGTSVAPAFTLQSGASDPFNGFAAASWWENWSDPAFFDADGDGDNDMVVGGTYGVFTYFENTGSAASPVFVLRTGAASPVDGFRVNFGSSPAFGDIDGDGDTDLVAGDANTATLTLFRNTILHGEQIAVTVTAEADPPALAGLAASVTFDETTVNATPQLLDADVTFSDDDGDYDGGTLTVSGLLAEDTVSVNNQGSGAGDVGLSGTDVTYGGVVIGTLAGGAGTTLTITFNANATSAAIDLLIESLTYANSSDTPTASRSLVLNITDVAGGDLGGSTSFAAAAGAANPFNGFTVFSRSAPTFADLDSDGDLDLVVGGQDGTLSVLRNGTVGAAGAFTQLTGADNPFNGIDVGFTSKPTFTDLDGDGDLDLVVGQINGTLSVFRNGTVGAAGAFAAVTGVANPFNGIDVGNYSQPTFTDLDGDGDLDLVVGELNGGLFMFRNGADGAAGAFTAVTGVANPFNGIDVGERNAPTFVDLDGDGDLDLVVGEAGANLNVFRNGTDGTAGAFIELTGADNPFNGIVSGVSAPSFTDLDGDGDQDLVLGENGGNIRTFLNTTPQGRTITVTVTAQADAPAATGLPTDVTVTEDVASDLDLSAIALTDPDTAGTITVILTASAGTITATTGGGVTVTNSGTSAITLAGTASAIDTYLNTASSIQYTGASNANGDDAATLTVTANDGSGAVTLGVVNIDITAVNDGPTLTGFASSVTVGENLVNATPQLLDADVTFADVEGNFDGGTLTVSGLLAEDRVAVNNEGSGAGQVGFDSGTGNVSYGGVVIGVAAGGVGGTLTVTFDADATSAAVDAVIQNLTYANVSDAPTASRNLVVNVTDAAGLDVIGGPAFTARTGAASPFNGINIPWVSMPAMADLDGDGDLDALFGESSGPLYYYENTGTVSAGAFTQRTGGANPFNGVNVGQNSAPAFLDLDDDGDLDAVIGNKNGTLEYFENTGAPTAPVFIQRTGASNPFNGIDVGSYSAPTFADLDGDGDLDAVVGDGNGALFYLENTGSTSVPAFTQRTGASNPFNGIDVGIFSRPTFTDLDEDGDLDAVIGEWNGYLHYFENTGTEAAPVFTQRTGSANPFDGIYVNFHAAPTFADMDNDGDLDLIEGKYDGAVAYLERSTAHGQTITVTVTAQADAPEAAGLPTDVTVVEDVASDLDLSAVTISDPDTAGDITVVLTASAGTMTASTGGGVTVSNTGTGAITLVGTASAIDAFLNTASSIRYTGAANASGDNAATLTITANDGSGAATLGVVNIDITAVNDTPSLTNLAASVSFGENLVNATPQLLDTDVTFADPDNNYDGGTLTVSGLLDEDLVSVNNQGSGAGQVGFDSGAGNVSYGGVVIGVASGGVGGTLSITFNADATSAAVDAVIQNLTYANSSDTPTASRDLVINVTDADGDNLGGAAAFELTSGAADPFNSVVFSTWATPAFADLDGDGDFDLVTGSNGSAVLRYYENVAGVFTEQTGAANPFDGIASGTGYSAPTFVDLDGDADLDLVVGTFGGTLLAYQNDAGVFNQLTGGANPFAVVTVGLWAMPAFGDIDGDGDKDVVIGTQDGMLTTYQNNGGVFTKMSGATNPFDGVDVGNWSSPTFVDIDDDGDEDLLVANQGADLRLFANGGGVFSELTGAANPLVGISLGQRPAPAFADLDGDGDLDLVLGRYNGILHFVENTTPSGQTITVDVTPEYDPIRGTAGADTLSATAGADIVYAGAGADTVDGGDGDDTLHGEDGDDYLKGGAGADAMSGGTGNDTYVVDDAGDTTDETGGDGIDLVISRISWTLAGGIENLTLGSGGSLTGTGNGLDNVIIGNSVDNTLNGLAGADTLNGGGGDDILSGGDDNDILDGGSHNDFLDGGGGDDMLIGGAGKDYLRGGNGADGMIGGVGNDFYVVDDAGDSVFELAGQGIDTVQSRISYTLGANVENLILGSAGHEINGTGNSLNNVITGNSFNNTLWGMDGNDTLDGGAASDILHGGNGNDTLNGGNHDDVLFGGAGYDKLTGGSGKDTFAFTNDDIRVSAGVAKSDKDQILDLNFAQGDRIDLSAIDANSTLGGDQAFTFLGAFTHVAGQAVMTFSAGVTTLNLDVDGDGIADLRIEINGNVTGTTANLYAGAGDNDGGWVL